MKSNKNSIKYQQNENILFFSYQDLFIFQLYDISGYY